MSDTTSQKSVEKEKQVKVGNPEELEYYFG